MKKSLGFVLSTYYKDDMILFVNSNADEFENLIKLALSKEVKISRRAAWLLSNCINENDQRLTSYLDQIISTFPTVGDGHQRDLINVIRKMDLDEDQEGLVFNSCVGIWCKVDKIPSVRCNALKLMMQITKKHPELFSEIELLTQEHYIEPLSKGIKSSIRKLILDFNKDIDT